MLEHLGWTELLRRWSVDLVTLCANERNRRLAEDTASAGHQEAQAAPPNDVRIVDVRAGGGVVTQAPAQRNPERRLRSRSVPSHPPTRALSTSTRRLSSCANDESQTTSSSSISSESSSCSRRWSWPSGP